jgi:hypothetical protein
MKKKWINVLLLCLITLCCKAQTEGYKFYCLLDSVKESGFYNIELTPELNAHLKTDYSDLRIVNSVNKWVPHVLHYPAAERNYDGLAMALRFTVTENTKTNSILIIENSQDIISNIGLTIRNTAAERFCTLSGSDDKQNWFIINDSISLNPVPAETGSENTFRIDFPPSSYRFFKIVIHNNNKDPFDVKRIIQIISSSTILHAPNRFIQNPLPVIEQKDSGKISYIKITQHRPWHFDNISLKVSGVKYFYRKIDLYAPLTEDHTLANPGQLIQSFSISNNSTLQFQLPLTKMAVFYLLINNQDNLPLRVNEVKTALNARFITAYLEKDSNYKLIMDNESAVLPDYDLSKLNSKISDSIPYVKYSSIKALKEDIPAHSVTKNNNWMIWSAIIAALVILLFFTFRMFKEVDKRKDI